ncbi:MAG: protein kinase [Okeania sp. SIO1H5]|uniref:serine/threonine protein kinase n=1 Tax=Okeania sp. SIO1H5 TaxID=2607777 RepID=UPI0013BDCE58|nr:serine/threonine-protein kinase [Okeania sp. SIO1H5]NET23675.1 protein kinase [Okeania sp. SIO1H5]
MLGEESLVGKYFDSCCIQEVLGVGGYGVSYLAFDEELKEHRVVKVCQTGNKKTSQKHLIRSFIEEGIILSRLKHPQIVTLRRQGESHGFRYMIMDFVAGYDLRQVFSRLRKQQLEKKQPWGEFIDPTRATALLLSALKPLEYAHEVNVFLPNKEIHGIAHRDIAPGNLILGSQGNEKGKVILIDFGTAKTDLSDSLTVNANLIGTVPYMSKARLQKVSWKELSPAGKVFWSDFRETQHDVHALGVLYYQLLTGELPFRGTTNPQIIASILDAHSYERVYQSIEMLPGVCSSLIRESVVFQDPQKPYEQQPFQYPDARAMKKRAEKAFQILSPHRSLEGVLQDFLQELGTPQKKSQPVLATGFTPSVASPVPLPLKPTRKIPFFVGFATVCLAGLALFLFLVKKPESPPAMRTLESFSNPSEKGLATESPSPANPESSTPVRKKPTLQNKPRKVASPQKAPDPREGETPGIDYSHKSSQPHSKPAVEEKLRRTPTAEINGELEKGESEGNRPSRPEGSIAQVQEDGQEHQVRETYFSLRRKVPAFNARSASARIPSQVWRDVRQAVSSHPSIPDFKLLEAEALLNRNLRSQKARRILASIKVSQPHFSNPTLFGERVLFAIWEIDKQAYQNDPSPFNRERHKRSSREYLNTFGAQSGYARKAARIELALAELSRTVGK